MKINFNKTLGLSLPLLALAAAVAQTPRPVRRARWVMGTVCEITAYGPGAAVTAAFEEMERLDRVMSLYKEDSELSDLNRSAGAEFRCSGDLWEAVSAALRYARLSGGAFDPTIRPVLQRGRRALAQTGHWKMALDPARRAARLKAGMSLDLGGIGKGIALDRAAAVLRREGASAALLNLGGQIYALGAPPGARGWEVVVPGFGTLLLSDASVSTSGNEERPGHIVDPRSGSTVLARPPVAVVAPGAAEADAWSTALFVTMPKRPPAFTACVLMAGADPGPACRRYIMKEKEKKHDA